jgi:hypothetical protein
MNPQQCYGSVTHRPRSVFAPVRETLHAERAEGEGIQKEEDQTTDATC